MAKKTVRIRCNIAEVRRRGDVPVLLPLASSGDGYVVVARDSVEVTTLRDGIIGAVRAVLVKDQGESLLVDIPLGQAGPFRASVPRSAVL